MYYINKIVGWLISPLGLMFLGTFAGMLMRLAGARAAKRDPECSRATVFAKAGAWLIGLSLAFLWVMSMGVTIRFVGVPLERPWERSGTMHGSIEGLPDADAVVILGGGVGSHKECHASELFSGADRVFCGARLYNAKKSSRPGLKVFCTGCGCEDSTLPVLLELGVPRESVWFSEEPRNTEEEARLIGETLRSGDSAKPRIYLVTSAWHMSRAKMLFERVGFDVVPVPTDFEMCSFAECELAASDFLPSADALLRNSYAMKEWIARFGYSIFRR
jgi:uncharacterized SAM-binding protein YcdF (DUF218 family)